MHHWDIISRCMYYVIMLIRPKLNSRLLQVLNVLRTYLALKKFFLLHIHLKIFKNLVNEVKTMKPLMAINLEPSPVDDDPKVVLNYGINATLLCIEHFQYRWLRRYCTSYTPCDVLYLKIINTLKIVYASYSKLFKKLKNGFEIPLAQEVFELWIKTVKNPSL